MTEPDPTQPPGEVTNDIDLFRPAEVSPEQIARLADELAASEFMATRTECIIDGKPITVMSFKGTGVCSEFCRKVYDGEIEDNRSER